HGYARSPTAEKSAVSNDGSTDSRHVTTAIAQSYFRSRLRKLLEQAENSAARRISEQAASHNRYCFTRLDRFGAMDFLLALIESEAKSSNYPRKSWPAGVNVPVRERH